MKDADSTIQTVPSTSPRRRPRSVTVSDVARLAGVSAMTVSRAVNTPEQVPVATLKKVQDAVAKTGYVPNLLAGGLRSNKSRLVAALVPTLAGPVFMETIQALTAALAENGYQLMLGQSGYAGSREDDLLGAIIGRRPDGIVLTGIMHSIEGRRRLLAAGIPVVETWDLTPTPIDMLVGFSHTEVGRSVCDYLHSRGRRRLAVMGGTTSARSVAIRLSLRPPSGWGSRRRRFTWYRRLPHWEAVALVCARFCPHSRILMRFFAALTCWRLACSSRRRRKALMCRAGSVSWALATCHWRAT